MKRRIKIVLVALIVSVITVPSILVWATRTQTFIFSNSLHVTDFTKSGDTYTANVTDAGRDIAHIYVRVENPVPNSNRVPILFSIWHTNNTELDSLSLKFTTEPYVTSLFLEASSYIWPQAEFHRNGKGILFYVEDLGWYGEGAITLDFILDPDPHSDNLALTIDFSMHYSGLMQLTALKGSSTLYSQLASL
jgi:hypothetical protein